MTDGRDLRDHDAADPSAVRPFVVDIPQADLDDLHRRLDATRWPAAALGDGWQRGVPPAYLRELARYWRHDYDWRAAERELNGFAQFTTEIDGQRVHFLHVRSPEPDAMPLVMTHGWPGSVAEFLKVLGPLTDPQAHGGDPRDAFHVVAPSLPGYGFSVPLAGTGWTVRRIAHAGATLMARLGYERYGAQGGDWGSAISRDLGVVDPAHVVGVHLNMLFTFPPRNAEDRAALSDADRKRLERLAFYEAELSGYFTQQATRPQTLGYALQDSPVGQLAWIVEKFREWTDSTNAPEDAVDRDQMLTNVMLYWLTGTGASSANLYYENTHTKVDVPVSTAPTGLALFAHDIGLPIRALAQKRNNIVRWHEYERGGHFAAMEQPAVLVDDMRGFFRALR